MGSWRDIMDRADAARLTMLQDRAAGERAFWSLAQSPSALCPTGSDEKRWVDGVLARKKGMEF